MSLRDFNSCSGTDELQWRFRRRFCLSDGLKCLNSKQRHALFFLEDTIRNKFIMEHSSLILEERFMKIESLTQHQSTQSILLKFSLFFFKSQFQKNFFSSSLWRRRRRRRGNRKQRRRRRRKGGVSSIIKVCPHIVRRCESLLSRQCNVDRRPVD